MQVGDWVYYHPRIGGPSDGKRYLIRRVGTLPSLKRVAWLQGKAGCVAIEALTMAEAIPSAKTAPNERITVCTFWTQEIESYAKWTTENKREYAERHGYGFHCPRECRTGRPPAWEKVFVVGEALARSEWVWWLDADAIVTNFETPLESLLDPNFDLIACKDFNGFNSGSFLLRSTRWATRFLWNVWRLEEYTHHPWWEQAAMMQELEKEENYLHTKFVDQSLLQSYVEFWKPGDFVLHVPGKPTAERAEILARINEQAKAKQDHATKGGA